MNSTCGDSGCGYKTLIYGLSCWQGFSGSDFTQRPHSSSFLGLPYRILYMNPNSSSLCWAEFYWAFK